MQKNDIKILEFQKKVWDYYHAHKRNFSWREDITPYRVFISEVMLQQTQTARVVFKFAQWIERFPDFASVARASTHDVLATWQGLGYNRRGLALQQAARMIMDTFKGQLPQDLEALESLPGIGPNTAGSISAFAFNLPVTFIETNIRTVFLHEFFPGADSVTDKEILMLVKLTVDQNLARDWYYALMDYGVHLKKELKANNKASKHYVRQSKFMGSRREVRGSIIRILTQMRQLSYDELSFFVQQEIPHNQHSIDLVLGQLIREGLVSDQDGVIKL